MNQLPKEIVVDIICRYLSPREYGMVADCGEEIGILIPKRMQLTADQLLEILDNDFLLDVHEETADRIQVIHRPCPQCGDSNDHVRDAICADLLRICNEIGLYDEHELFAFRLLSRHLQLNWKEELPFPLVGRDDFISAAVAGEDYEMIERFQDAYPISFEVGVVPEDLCMTCIRYGRFDFFKRCVDFFYPECMEMIFCPARESPGQYVLLADSELTLEFCKLIVGTWKIEIPRIKDILVYGVPDVVEYFLETYGVFSQLEESKLKKIISKAKRYNPDPAVYRYMKREKARLQKIPFSRLPKAEIFL